MFAGIAGSASVSSWPTGARWRQTFPDASAQARTVGVQPDEASSSSLIVILTLRLDVGVVM